MSEEAKQDRQEPEGHTIVSGTGTQGGGHGTIEIDDLTRIFRPRALERTQKAREERRRFVHYTSAENAIKIISSKQIWLRNVRCMNDYLEVLHGQYLVQKFLDDQQNVANFAYALNQCSDGIADEALGLLKDFWENIQFDTYISCISEHEGHEDNHGRLSMWRGFGRLSVRAALVLQPDSAFRLPVILSPVEYFLYEKFEKEFQRVISSIRNNVETLRRIDRKLILRWISFTLRTASVSLKHKGFGEEKEWRMIYTPKIDLSPVLDNCTTIIDGIPQLIYKMPLKDDISIPELVERIIIGPSPFVGPSPFPFPIVEAFVFALREAGMSDEEARSRVVASEIPLRT